MPVNISGTTLGQSTKDATALPEDVRSGKIFYGANGKSTGILNIKEEKIVTLQIKSNENLYSIYKNNEVISLYNQVSWMGHTIPDAGISYFDSFYLANNIESFIETLYSYNSAYQHYHMDIYKSLMLPNNIKDLWFDVNGEAYVLTSPSNKFVINTKIRFEKRALNTFLQKNKDVNFMSILQFSDTDEDGYYLFPSFSTMSTTYNYGGDSHNNAGSYVGMALKWTGTGLLFGVGFIDTGDGSDTDLPPREFESYPNDYSFDMDLDIKIHYTV